MEKKISKDLPISELTLRKYEKPTNIQSRDLVKKFCLSLGLLQPGDSRDVMVDVLWVLLKSKKDKEELDIEEIQKRVIASREKNNLPVVGVAQSNLRRQIRRLREIHIAEKVKNSYRVNEFENIKNIFNEKIREFVLPSILARIELYSEMLDKI